MPGLLASTRATVESKIEYSVPSLDQGCRDLVALAILK
jgi:hypothetical protein